MSEIQAQIFNDLPFTQTPNITARDKRISLEARGCLTYLLSHSKTFHINIDFLLKEFNIGRDKLLRITNELKEFGYLNITHYRDAEGKFINSKWHIYGISQDIDFRNTENTDNRKTRDTENTDIGKNRTTENPYELQKKSIKEEKLKEEEKQCVRNAPTPEVISIFREYFPNYEPPVFSQELMQSRITDLTVWRQTLIFWASNDYRPQSIGKLCDKYDENKNEVKQNGTHQGNNIQFNNRQNGTRPSAAEIILNRDYSKYPKLGEWD